MFSVAYPMIKNTADWLSRRFGIQVVVVPIQFPLTSEGGGGGAAADFLNPMNDTLTKLLQQQQQQQGASSSKSLDRLKMVVLEHIVSTPAVKEPIQELAAMIKRFQPNCFVLVDGAHAIGQIRHLDLSKIGNMDAYLSNGHKWLYSPKGSAFLWINTTSGFISDTFPEPTVISSGNPIGSTSLSERYSYVSTKDYTAFLSMDAALEFRQTILGGDEAIYQYCRTLALDAKHYLMDLWNVTIALAPDEMEEFMINIPLPTSIGIDSKERGMALQEYLLKDHGVYMIVAFEPSSGLFYTRLSAQVYLELWDFQRLGHLVLDFGNKNKFSSHQSSSSSSL